MKRSFVGRTTLLVATTAAALITAGCKQVSYTQLEENATVSFTTQIGDREGTGIETRLSPTGPTSVDWDEGDAIGVFMIAAGGTLADHSLARNVAHIHTAGGAFAVPAGATALSWPRAGRVDFVACYPWRAALDGDLYPIDLGGRNDPGTMDFIYSDNAVGHSAGDVPLLRFHHRLAKLVFDVTDATGADIGGLTAVVSGPLTRGTFDLSAGTLAVDEAVAEKIVAARVEDGDGDSATERLEAIVMPCAVVAPTVDFTLPDGSTARLTLTRSAWERGNVYTYRVRVTEGGTVELTGGTTIDNWDDRDRAPDDYEIPKHNPNDDPDDPDDPTDPSVPGGVELYFAESFGDGGTVAGVAVGDYSGWDNGAPVSFAERFGEGGEGGARVCRTEDMDTHIAFPAGANADFSIRGLPSGRSEITLGYDVAAGRGGTPASMLRLYADDENITSRVTTLIPSPNHYVRVFVSVPSGATSLRFVADGVSNAHGMRLDNIRLEGRKQ